MPTIASLTRRHKKTPLARLLHKRQRPTAPSSVFDAARDALRSERVTALRAQLREKATQLMRGHRAQRDGRE